MADKPEPRHGVRSYDHTTEFRLHHTAQDARSEDGGGAAYPNLAPHSSLTGRRGVAFRVMACTLVRWAVAVGTLRPAHSLHSSPAPLGLLHQQGANLHTSTPSRLTVPEATGAVAAPDAVTCAFVNIGADDADGHETQPATSGAGLQTRQAVGVRFDKAKSFKALEMNECGGGGMEG
ncbi:uncharacterized protein EHS24_000751 [Apiotrichum porosum]|uniref:Uncharacterized protein n=1 Tax=Apiotrichum porosum TaxID=105984 RepID=A0A427YAN6_9TREE|nr:uncharacterized protein EHS24_000751 [Apiotrichum porosum]RSH88220.1 hypothetical protein EHS24_000751 [Apiotrichum porosum]